MQGPKPYLRQITLEHAKIPKRRGYPFNIPAVRALETLQFHPDVTFIIGENGSGKSTLVEAIAVALGLNAEGGNRNSLFHTKPTHSELHEYLKIVRSYAAPQDVYFLRAESFYNLASLMDEVGYLRSYGGKSLHAQSHGESFMATLVNKLTGNGLYIFDEPEAALSPSRQMAALTRIHQLVQQKSQFIIATHSPILLSYPNSTIYQLDSDGYQVVPYEETEHYRITRDFLNRHERMLEILLDDSE